jgi:hypothetical protein
MSRRVWLPIDACATARRRGVHLRTARIAHANRVQERRGACGRGRRAPDTRHPQCHPRAQGQQFQVHRRNDRPVVVSGVCLPCAVSHNCGGAVRACVSHCQAAGLVNHHKPTCFVFPEAEAEWSSVKEKLKLTGVGIPAAGGGGGGSGAAAGGATAGDHTSAKKSPSKRGGKAAKP